MSGENRVNHLHRRRTARCSLVDEFVQKNSKVVVIKCGLYIKREPEQKTSRCYYVDTH